MFFTTGSLISERERQKKIMNIESHVKDYIESEILNPYNPKHINHHGKPFRYFKEFLGDRELHEIRIKEALEFQGFVIDKGGENNQKLAPGSVNGYMGYISNFYEYLKTNNLVFDNPFSMIKRLRGNITIPKNILSEKNLRKLLNYYRNWNHETHLSRRVSRYRMHVISELMFSTGLRIREVSNLVVDDIDLFNGLVNVREGKGGFNRKAILNDYAKNVLHIYINSMRELTFSKFNRANGNILFGMKYDALVHYVNDSLLKTTQYLGIDRISSHCFRHALGYHLLKAGCDIRHIQEILGHKALTSTEVYTKVDKEDLRKVMEKYHPRQMRRSSCEAYNK